MKIFLIVFCIIYVISTLMSWLLIRSGYIKNPDRHRDIIDIMIILFPIINTWFAIAFFWTLLENWCEKNIDETKIVNKFLNLK